MLLEAAVVVVIVSAVVMESPEDAEIHDVGDSAASFVSDLKGIMNSPDTDMGEAAKVKAKETPSNDPDPTQTVAHDNSNAECFQMSSDQAEQYCVGRSEDNCAGPMADWFCDLTNDNGGVEAPLWCDPSYKCRERVIGGQDNVQNAWCCTWDEDNTNCTWNEDEAECDSAERRMRSRVVREYRADYLD